MNSKEARQFDMLLRVEDLGTSPSSSVPRVGARHRPFADVSGRGQGAGDDTPGDRHGVSLGAGAPTARRQPGGRSHGVLVKVSHTAKVLRHADERVGPFAVPFAEVRPGAADGGAAVRARCGRVRGGLHRARDAVSDSLPTTATAFETALRDRGMSRTQFRAGRARTRDLLARAVDDVRALDVIIHNQLPGDKAIQDVWKQARRVEESRARTGGAGEEPAADATNRTTAAAADAA